MDELIHRWRQLGVLLPVAFVAAVSAIVVLGLGEVLPDLAVVAVITAVVALGAIAFSSWTFRVVGQHSARRSGERAT